jgi:hypothetical protein
MIKITTVCQGCGSTEEIPVDEAKYEMWKRRQINIQDAFPRLTASQRERLQTGYCDPCWDKLWCLCEDGAVNDDCPVHG